MNRMAHDYRLNFRLENACKGDISKLCANVCSSQPGASCGGLVLHCLRVRAVWERGYSFKPPDGAPSWWLVMLDSLLGPPFMPPSGGGCHQPPYWYLAFSAYLLEAAPGWFSQPTSWWLASSAPLLVVAFLSPPPGGCSPQQPLLS